MTNKEYIHFKNKWYDLANLNTIVKHLTRNIQDIQDGSTCDSDTSEDCILDSTVHDSSNASYKIGE